jgi:tRNA modification GTPase
MRMAKIIAQLERLLSVSSRARLLQEGLRCVICGKTNAGKSTLFNRLLKEERAIVSKIPGTTRDVIEETITIRGVPLRIYDTAGILEPHDLIDKKAIEKTSHAFGDADMIIIVLDGSRPLDKDDYLLLDKTKALLQANSLKCVIPVINKSDLTLRLKRPAALKSFGPCVTISALKNIGIRDLEQAVARSVYKHGINRHDSVLLTHYQLQILRSVKEELNEANNFLAKHYPIDFINISLKNIVEALGKLSGEVLSEEVLESIFSNFCIGK